MIAFYKNCDLDTEEVKELPNSSRHSWYVI